MPNIQPKPVSTRTIVRQDRPAVTAYDPYFAPRLSRLHEAASAAGQRSATTAYDPYFPKLARAVA